MYSNKKTWANNLIMCLAIVAILVSTIIMSFISIPQAKAEETQFVNENIPSNQIERKIFNTAKEFSVSWIAKMYHNDGTSINEISILKDIDDNYIGAIVDLSKDDVVNGNFVLDLTKQGNQVLKSFSLTSGKLTTLSSSTKSFQSSVSTKVVYDINGFKYGIKSGNKIFGENGKEYEVNRRTSSRSISDGITDELVSLTTISDFALISNSVGYFNPITTTELESGVGNCVLTALVNSIKLLVEYFGFYKFVDPNMDSLNKLTLTQCKTIYSELRNISTAQFGKHLGLNIIQAEKIIEIYAAGKGCDLDFGKFFLNIFNDWKKAIKLGYPVYTRFDMNDDGDGHATVAVAFVEGKINNTDARYLGVCSGWNNDIDYLNYNYYPDVDGAKIICK